MSWLPGSDAKLYIKDGDKDSGGSYIEFATLNGDDLGGDHSESDVSTRGSGGIKARAIHLKDFTISGSAVYDPEDAALMLVESRWYNKGVIAVKCVTADVSDTDNCRGPWFNAVVKKFQRKAPVDGHIEVDIEIVPTHPVDLEWIGTLS